MKWYTYDAEVFKYDFIVVFKDKETGEYAEFHNDNDGVRRYIMNEGANCGFNTKWYDQFIIKAICSGYSPEEVKAINDFIIAGGNGWDCPLLKGIYFNFNNVDIKDDVQQGLSLKAIEGHLGMSIQESSIDFNIDRPLTAEEVKETFKYCRHDVDATEKLTDIRKDYLRTKLNLGRRANIPEMKSLSATNAKLTAMMLGAVRKEWYDGRNYVYPPNLDISIIPQPILEFFDSIHDMSIPDDVLFKTSFTIDIAGMLTKYAWGGVHGSLTTYYEETTEDRIVQNRDVSSLYPSLIEEYNYLSRNVPNPQLFYDIRKDRIRAKHEKDKQTANDLKLPLNTVSGAQENKYNDLYDPLPTRSLRISGQLFLTMLVMQLLKECKTIKLLNFNTDGLMYSIDKTELPIVDRVCSEWEKTTHFELETDDIKRVWIKDVNNLLLEKMDGEVKKVGGYLNYGISTKGAWSINNNAIIVKQAIEKYFINGIPVETTINECQDIFLFQIIAKAGSKYKEAYHLVDGKKIPVQKVNRVYATADTRYGKLYKVKAENDATAKIEMLPEHCIIDNDNQLTIEAVDKTFYIEMAKKRINDYLGIQPEKKGTKKMATETTKSKKTNVFQKLLNARVDFHTQDVKKSGKNMQLSSKYFELDDIVPVALPIFKKHGLLPVTTFDNELAVMKIYDVDSPEDVISFTSPMKEIDPIISSRTGGEVVNAIQRLGSVETYQRRYLYMAALDIVENDTIEPLTGMQPLAPSTNPVHQPTSLAVASASQTTESKLTDANGNASELQIKQLKEALSKLREADPSSEEMIANLAVQTQAFTVLSKADCEKLIVFVNEKLNKEG